MNIKQLVVFVSGILPFPMLADAQAQAANEQGSTWVNLFWGILPFIILIAVIVPLIRRMQKPILKRSQEHMERSQEHMKRQIQHMERVEQSLDRIIKLLEKKD